jgi:hypothetical protein
LRVTVRRWLPWVVALAVVVVTAVVVLAMPNGHECHGVGHPVRDQASGHVFWVCASYHPIPAKEHGVGPLAATNHRVPLRIGIALGGLALAVALGVAVQKAYPPASERSSRARATQDALR